MNRKAKSLLTLTMIALVVSIIDGIFDIAYDMRRTFEASAVNEHGERISVRLAADGGRPSFLWHLAWKVGGQIVTNVTLSVSITPSGTNVNNLKVTYYLKGVSGANSKKFLEATDYPVTSGVEITNTTGSVDINIHLSDLGLATNQDQTVNYTIYCRLEATGAISGDLLVAEITETIFDTVFYDYGTVSNVQIWPTADNYVASKAPDDNYGTYTSLVAGAYYSSNDRIDKYRSYIEFDLSGITDIISAKLYMCTYFYEETDFLFAIHRVTGSWSESTLTWNNQPTWDTSSSVTFHHPNANGYFNVDVTSITQENTEISYVIKLDDEDGVGTSGDLFYFRSRDKSGEDEDPYLLVDYAEFSASWSWLFLPLSIVSLPIGQQFIAIVFMMLAFAVWAVSRERRKNRRGRRRKR